MVIRWPTTGVYPARELTSRAALVRVAVLLTASLSDALAAVPPTSTPRAPLALGLHVPVTVSVPAPGMAPGAVVPAPVTAPTTVPLPRSVPPAIVTGVAEVGSLKVVPAATAVTQAVWLYDCTWKVPPLTSTEPPLVSGAPERSTDVLRSSTPVAALVVTLKASTALVSCNPQPVLRTSLAALVTTLAPVKRRVDDRV